MTYLEALDQITHPVVARYREFCSDDWPDTHQRAAYRAMVIRHACGEAAPDPPALAAAVAAIKLVRSCLFRSQPSCACEGHRCGLRSGGRVSDHDCLACVRTYDQAIA